MKWRKAIRLNLDPRSLALFRIALGCILLVVSIQLSSDFAVFYQFSPHAGGVRFLLDFVLPVAAFALALGCFTRVATVACWICVILIQAASPHILYGADRLTRVLLFWSIFLPLGSCWSVDALALKSQRLTLPRSEYWAAWAFALQLALLYWFAAFQKSDPVWTQSHDALFYAISMEYVATPLGLYSRQAPWLLRDLTAATMALEYLGPVLLFIPFYRDRLRFLATILFLSFHLVGMGLLMHLGYFPWICAAAWLVFIPAFFWNFVGSAARLQPVSQLVSWRIRWVDLGATLVLFLAMADALVWNFVGLRGPDIDEWMMAHDPLRPVLHIDQTWRLFSPYPQVEHGWVVVPAQLADGTEVDLFTGRPVSWAKPADIYAYYGEFRLAMLATNLYVRRHPETIRHYADYLTLKWNDAHPQDKVHSLSIIFMRIVTLPDLTMSPPEKVVLYPLKN